MKYLFYILTLHVTLIPFYGFPQKTANNRRIENAVEYQYTPYSVTRVILTSEEKGLYDLLTEYLQAKGKSVIPLSVALSYVARTHAADLNDHYKPDPVCNLHSWSPVGPWSPCCYTKDHANAGCSWSKPKELTTYEGDGFEMICYVAGGRIPESALRRWKQNGTNNNMILSKHEWKNVTWNAVGIGIYGHYAAVWFGKLADKDGKPGIPE